MKAHWQRSLLVSVLAFIGMAIITVSVRASSLPDHHALNKTHNPASSYIASMPLTDTGAYTLYLPLITRPPGMLYGTVTEYGVPAANVGIGLRRCLAWSIAPGGEHYCTTWDTYSTSTDHNGWYAFIDPPTLVITPGDSDNQIYEASWYNYPAVPNRLDRWDSRVIDSYTEGDFVNLGTFDIGGITLLTPTAGSDVHFPVTFQWIPRHNVPHDAYIICVSGGLFIPKFNPYDLVCPGPYGYTDQFIMNTPFDGIDYGEGYSWYVTVPDDTGGVGYSSSIPFTFAPP